MPWAALTLAAIVATGALVALVLIALKLSRIVLRAVHETTSAHTSTLATLERIHGRNMEQISSMADRFMALDFASFKAYEAAGVAEEGGFELPEEYGRVERPLAGGRYAVVGADAE